MSRDPGRYYRVSTRFWLNPEVRAWPDDARLLALYLLTCHHRNMVGLFHCPLAYMGNDLGWVSKRLRNAFETLVQADFARFDPDTDIVLITNALAFDPPDNPNQVKAAVKIVGALPHTPLLAGLIESADKHCEALAKALRKGFATVSKPIPKPTRSTVTVSVTESIVQDPASTKPTRGGKTSKATDPRVKALVDAYHDRYVQAFGKKPHIVGGKHGTLAKRLLSTADLPELLDCLDRYFADRDPFVRKAGWTLEVFESRLQGYRLARKEGPDVDWSREPETDIPV